MLLVKLRLPLYDKADTVAAEKAERDAIVKAKADKAKVYEDRHKANADTLADLKKLLVSLDHLETLLLRD